jgi:hypothetical protein
MSSRRIAHEEIIKLTQQCSQDFKDSIKDLIAEDGRSERYCYVLEYKYGEPIIGLHGLEFPKDISEDLKKDIKNDISKAAYGVPFGFVLKNNAELFLNNESDIPKSITILTGSQPIGSYEAADFMKSLPHKAHAKYRPEWQVIAGTRSIFLPALFKSSQVRNNLNNLLKNNGFEGLEPYQRASPSFDQDIFPFVRDLIQTKSFGVNDWNTTLIIFPDKWLEIVRDKISKFHQCIYNAAWSQSEHFRNKEALTSKIFRHLQYYQGTQTYTFCTEVLLDLFEIGLGDQHCYQIVEKNSLELNGPFPRFIELLQTKLDMDKNPLLMLEPAYIQTDSEALKKGEYFYSATSLGKVLSSLNQQTQSSPNLSNLFFKPLSKILHSPVFLDEFKQICGKKISFQLYGKYGTKRDEINLPDIRSIFNFSDDRRRSINYTHPFLLGCIKIEFVDE